MLAVGDRLEGMDPTDMAADSVGLLVPVDQVGKLIIETKIAGEFIRIF